MTRIIFLLILLFDFSIFRAQELVNAFDDLKRKGEVKQSVSEMTRMAVSSDLEKLRSEHPEAGYFCFTEDRLHDIRTGQIVPQRWVDRPKPDRTVFNGVARPGEFYVWQIGVYAPYFQLDEVRVKFSDLKNEQGDCISSILQRCFNTEGVDAKGNSFTKTVTVQQDTVRPLWVGVQVPATAQGHYRGWVIVQVKGCKSTKIAVDLFVQGDAILLQGDTDGWRKSRLRWLDSRIGIADRPTVPYIPIDLTGKSIRYLGGVIELAETGLPKRITTCYDSYNQLSDQVLNPVLAGEMRLEIETADGIEKLKPGKLEIEYRDSARIFWKTNLKNRFFRVVCRGTAEFDGSMSYRLEVSALKNIAVRDIRLIVPYSQYASRYQMGLGRKGGFRPSGEFEWYWNTDRHQDKIWMGNVNAGLNIRFKDSNYVRPLVNIYYALGKLNLPESWGNDKKGGVRISESPDSTVLLEAFSGDRFLDKNQTLHYDFDLLVTPVKPIDLKRLCQERFFHKNSDLSVDYITQAKAAGANYINIHHKKDIYPFINYPYSDESIEDLKAFTVQARKESIGTRVYYTTRELTVKIPELWALRSLGNEVIHDGPGRDTRTLIHRNGPNAWLNENLSTHFIPAWYNAFNEGKYKGDMDISVITTPDSRWNNYYLEGLQFLLTQVGIEGIYIDDSALDRETLQRARRILDADGKRRQIDIHSWNHFNQWAGFANSIHIYLDLLPYVDRTWLGEGFTAQNSPDFWLVEMSGIPFGLVSETLDAHNLYRGMVFGMLPRLGWSGNPVPLWHLWDHFGMGEARIVGWWNDERIVEIDDEQILATVYLQSDRALIAVANWSDNDKKVTLHLDMNRLGFVPARISVPSIEGLQAGKSGCRLSEPISVSGKSGLILLLEK